MKRHGFDRWKDILFIGIAVLIAGLAIGSVTTKAQGRPPTWGVVMIEQPTILDPTLKDPNAAVAVDTTAVDPTAVDTAP
nr:hypothetical protein [Kofleriaceae bacterium]